jgi:hypothetical protein
MKNVLCVRTIKITKFKNIHEYFQKTMVCDLEPILHSQDIRTFFFDPSTHYAFRTITELIEILYIVFCFCHIILNTHSTSNMYMYKCTLKKCADKATIQSTDIHKT